MRKYSSTQFDKSYFDGLLIDPDTIFSFAKKNSTRQEVIECLERDNLDDFDKEALEFLKEGMLINKWQYVDNLTVLYSAAKLLKVKNYLEIGVRKGRSLGCVMGANPKADLYCFDNWTENYAGLENGNKEYVEEFIKNSGHQGYFEIISGDSRKTIPEFLNKNQNLKFDLIFVDGDHSYEGAYEDLKNCVDALSPGGIIVFDDIAHPLHYYLLDVWRKIINDNPQLHDKIYSQLGRGVAVAVNRSSYEISNFKNEKKSSWKRLKKFLKI